MRRATSLPTPRFPAVLLDDPPGEPDAEGLCAADIVIADGQIERVAPAGRHRCDSRVDLDRGMVLAGLRRHAHPYRQGPYLAAPAQSRRHLHGARSTRSAPTATATGRPRTSRRRMDFSLRCAYAHGTVAAPHPPRFCPRRSTASPGRSSPRCASAGPAASSCRPCRSFAIERVPRRGLCRRADRRPVAEHGGVLGAVTYMVARPRAPDRDDDRTARRIAASTSTSTSTRPATRPRIRAPRHRRRRASARLSRAGSSPAIAARSPCRPTAEAEAHAWSASPRPASPSSRCRCATCICRTASAGRTPRWRGVTLIHELMARGVPVAVASDNTRDPFYAYGDLDMLEVFREAVRIVHLDHPFGDWATPRRARRRPRSSAASPTRRASRAGRRPISSSSRAAELDRAPGPAASRPHRPARRHAIDRTLPDYRELDDLMGSVRAGMTDIAASEGRASTASRSRTTRRS